MVPPFLEFPIETILTDCLHDEVDLAQISSDHSLKIGNLFSPPPVAILLSQIPELHEDIHETDVPFLLEEFQHDSAELGFELLSIYYLPEHNK
jgi:hypothetical protein